MPVNRTLVGLVALVVLVWSVAFGGGVTIAALTANANVTTTFETVDEFSHIENTSASEMTRTVAVVGNASETDDPRPKNGTSINETDANGTDDLPPEAPPANGTDLNEPASDEKAQETNGSVSQPTAAPPSPASESESESESDSESESEPEVPSESEPDSESESDSDPASEPAPTPDSESTDDSVSPSAEQSTEPTVSSDAESQP